MGDGIGRSRYGGITDPLGFVWFAFAGGLGAAAVVYGIGSAGPGGASLVKLALAGMIVSALLSSWLMALLLLDQQTLDVVRFWLVGSLAGRSLGVFYVVLPFLAIGLVGTMLIGHQINILSMGEDAARSLGMRTGRMRALVAVLVVLLAERRSPWRDRLASSGWPCRTSCAPSPALTTAGCWRSR